MGHSSWITKIIKDFVTQSPLNDMGFEEPERIFDTPLVGFSSGLDPLYDEYKSHIGNFYFTPLELFAESFPGKKYSAEDLTVVSWIIPSTAVTRKEHGAQKRYPSERWARTRDFGEKFNNAIRIQVVEQLKTAGIAGVAPLLAPHWARYSEGPYAPCSNWSERHAAYAAGLGTFGLCDGLITPVGKAVRIGSVIAAIQIPPSTRPYDDHHAYCLHFTENICRKCIPRCPIKALSQEGHDKKPCMQYVEHTMNKYIKKEYGLETYACGLCQCNVPCTDKIPTSEDV
ncbi:MAG: epoxyqueuosine reductase [Desulfobacterales bacterium]|jgi:epoxyqueuosine reductase|nr:epoxyqueuosine reductase [Desulfobacterales bacterium]